MQLEPIQLDPQVIKDIHLPLNNKCTRIIVIEANGEASCCELPEHGETTIVTARGEGYKVKHNVEYLLKKKK